MGGTIESVAIVSRGGEALVQVKMPATEGAVPPLEAKLAGMRLVEQGAIAEVEAAIVGVLREPPEGAPVPDEQAIAAFVTRVRERVMLGRLT